MPLRTATGTLIFGGWECQLHSHFGRCLADSYKAKCHTISSCASKYLPNWFKIWNVHTRFCMEMFIVAFLLIIQNQKILGCPSTGKWIKIKNTSIQQYIIQQQRKATKTEINLNASC